MNELPGKKEDRAHTLKLYNTVLNSLSHELRTPIATIIGATDTLQLQQNLSAFDKGELIFEISKASIRLNHQVENLLSMSRLESGFLKPNKDWCDLNEIVYEVMKMLEENKYKQHINININPDLPMFRLDKGMMQQIIYNLLNNAILYTQPDASIQLMAFGYGDVLNLIVEDNGPGFPDDEIEHVFEKFYRLKKKQNWWHRSWFVHCQRFYRITKWQCISEKHTAFRLSVYDYYKNGCY